MSPLIKVHGKDAHLHLGILLGHHSSLDLQVVTLSVLLLLRIDVYYRTQITFIRNTDVPGSLTASLLRTAIRKVLHEEFQCIQT